MSVGLRQKGDDQKRVTVDVDIPMWTGNNQDGGRENDDVDERRSQVDIDVDRNNNEENANSDGGIPMMEDGGKDGVEEKDSGMANDKKNW